MKNLVTESDFVETYDDFLSESICSELISLVDEENERIERSHKPNFYQRNIGNLPEYTGLYKKFSEIGMKYLTDIGYYDDILPQKYGFEEMRIKKYDVGDSFDTHIDVSDYASARRWLAFLVYLNDNFTGGETEFVDGKMIHPKIGSVLVFPSLWTFPHAGLPVKSGTKYILTTYFHYI